MSAQGHESKQQARERRAWELLGAVENHPQVRTWLTEAAATNRGSRRTWAIAASLVLAIGLSIGIWSMRFAGTHYETQVGEQRDVNLPDGSRITLNTDTALTVHYSDQRRFIEIQRGEALFSVKRDVNRPFDVTAGATLTTALGTEFNVDIRSSTVTVSVLEGAVRISASANGEVKDKIRLYGETAKTTPVPVVALTKGQALEVHQRDGSVREDKADLRRIDAWRTRRLEFGDTALREAVGEFNRYSTAQIVIGTPELADIRVSGVFRIGDTDGFLFALRGALQIEVHPSKDEIVLLRPSPTEK